MKKASILFGCLTAALSIYAEGWNEMSILARPDNNGGLTYEYDNRIQRTAFTNAIFFDYNNDNNLDLLIMASGADWINPRSLKFMLLYKNLGPDANYELRRVPDTTTGFIQAADEAWLNPITVGDVNNDGYTDIVNMNYRNARHINLYLNNKGTGNFTHKYIDRVAFTNGAVTLGDINNDGNLDILANGYDDSSTYDGIAIYIGAGDGTFTKTAPANMFGTFEGHSTLADMNGDGTLDVAMTGHGGNWSRHAKLYYNTIDNDGTTQFTLVDADKSGLATLNLGDVLPADFNADGLMDLALCGNDGSATGVRMFYQNTNGTFSLDTSYPICSVNTDGGINMADWDADGNMDIVVGGYIGTNAPSGCYSTPLRIYRNTSDANNRPQAPTEVSATQVNDFIEISWTDGSDDVTTKAALRYNFFVRNESTGETYCLIPADTETGNLKVGTDLATSISALKKTYRIHNLGNGDYTIGVQTLDQSFAPSKFNTITLNVSGVSNVSNDNSNVQIVIEGQTITVATDNSVGGDSDIFIYHPDGRLCKAGLTNMPIKLPAHGVYLVTAPDSDMSPRKIII